MNPGPSPLVRGAVDHIRAGRLKQAAESLRLHLRRHPDDDHAQFLLGNVLSQQLQEEPAIYALERAATLRPGDPQRWIALGTALLRARGPAPAEAVLRACPVSDDSGVRVLLGEVLGALNRASEAVPLLERVIASEPQNRQALRSLAKIFATAGRTDEAIEFLARAINDGDFRSLSAHCFHTNYSGKMSREAVFNAHQRLYEAVKKLVPVGPPPSPRETGGGPLRIGFMSADFQQHSVSYFVEPLLEHLDRARFRVIGMATSAATDEVTTRLRSKADEWVDASDQNPAAMTEAIRRAKPDILIDLGGLTGPGRVVALASRIAPLQATYLGYPNTCAVPNVDWRLVDALTDPVEPGPDGKRADAFATERLVRIEGCFVCYRPPDEAPPVAVRPAGAPVAFGSFNTSQKVSPECVQLWARVLRQVPGSVLVLKRREFADPWIAGQFIEAFEREGVEASRLRFLGKTPSVAEHLAAYAEVDIALDTYPYHGTTTTCEALWMGVPVVSLIGQAHASRVGLSLLNATGLGRLAATSPKQFEDAAAALAADRPALAAMRTSLRPQLSTSTICDGPSFAARFAEALLTMQKSLTSV
jgi:protein O-GlcNAc transferase